jgi:hypothetical protein
MLLTGWDFGIGVFANDTFGDNGFVTDTGEGYDAYDGRKVRMSGDVVMVELVPDVFVPTLDGVLQLN